MSANLKIHTYGISKNPPLLFLHAFPFSAAMWKEQITYLSEKFYCIAPDLPGFGETPLADHAVTLEYFTDSVIDYLKSEEIEKSVWCGLSMGGYVALRMYERAPELCRGLILCDTKAGADCNEAKLKRWDTIKLLQKSRKEFIAAQWKALVGESSRDKTHLKARVEEMMNQVSAQGIAAGLVALATRTDSTEGLSKIAVPTLIVVGEEDTVTPPKEAEAMAKAIRGSELKKIPKAGHLSNLEDSQVFNQHLSSFLDSLK